MKQEDQALPLQMKLTDDKIKQMEKSLKEVFNGK
jgi:hypothetical protein